MGKPDGLLQIGGFSINILPFVMTAANMASALIYGKKLSRRENVQLYGISTLFLVVLYNSPSALLIYWTFNNIFSFVRNLLYKYFYNPKENAVENNRKKRSLTLLYIFSVLSLGILLFLAGPFTLLASGSASDIDGTFSQFLYFQLMLLTVYLTAVSLIYHYSPFRLRQILTPVFSILSIYTLLNAFVFSGNYGDISNFYFENGIKVSTATIVTNVTVLVVTAVAVSGLFFVKKTKYLTYLSVIASISLLLLSYSEAKDFVNITKNEKTEKIIKLDKKFTFSGKKNVLIIMMDRFIGGYIPKIFELYPQLNETLDGFTWYSNSLSSGSDTLSSEPSIMGGWDYHADHVNKDQNRCSATLKKWMNHLEFFPTTFQKPDISLHFTRDFQAG